MQIIFTIHFHGQCCSLSVSSVRWHVNANQDLQLQLWFPRSNSETVAWSFPRNNPPESWNLKLQDSNNCSKRATLFGYILEFFWSRSAGSRLSSVFIGIQWQNKFDNFLIGIPPKWTPYFYSRMLLTNAPWHQTCLLIKCPTQGLGSFTMM